MWVWIEFDSVFVSPLGASVCREGESFPCKSLYELKIERCIDNRYLCDGHNDCYNNERGSDEMFCLYQIQHGSKF